jgi:2-C-methyl-D-erythritol 4-phosphate cytidylyltransferase
MEENVKTIAIIVAAGLGTRMGRTLSKQYLMLDNKPILVHTLKIFEKASTVDQIIVVVPNQDISYVRQEIIEFYEISKIQRVISGGKERQDSVNNGLKEIPSSTDIVLIHDGVRPFVSEDLINISVTTALEKGAVTLGVPVKDTIKSADANGLVSGTLQRDTLWLTQTPQVFKNEIIQEAYKKAYDHGYYGTDDASLVERMGVNVAMIKGSYDNIKITTPDDLHLGEFLLHKRSILT